MRQEFLLIIYMKKNLTTEFTEDTENIALCSLWLKYFSWFVVPVRVWGLLGETRPGGKDWKGVLEI
ncbi:MAG: hypothetical protein B6230_00755 [Desulfobacteraceae bacterium 4572_89]|nr:MAG: hypothetical protein B6230_00755 [Desulfobacteraceae bacterium 4572_89]